MANEKPQTNDWWSGDLRAASAPTPQQRKTEAEITSTETGTGKTVLDAEGVYLANQKKRRELGLPVLTPAQEAADKEYAKEQVAWRNTGGMPTLNRQLGQLQDALNILRTNDTITGPVLGRMPKFIQQAIDPRAPDVRAQVEDVIQRSLKQVLGGQFAAVEATQLLARAFDPEQQEKSNIDRIQRVVDELRGMGAAKEASARFFEKNGTLQGFSQKETDQVLKEFGVANKPSGGQAWMTGTQEAVLNRYAQGAPTAQGYADLLIQMAQEQGFQPDEAWRKDAYQRGLEVEKYRASGREFGEGINYLGGVPKPEEGEGQEDKTVAALPAEGAPPGAPPSDTGGLSWGEAAGSAAQRFLPNLAEVGVDTISGLFNVVTSPIQTAKSFGELGSSLLGAMGVTDADPAQAEALGNYFANRYGSMENIKKTFANEPAALLFDLSAVLTGGGTGAAKLASLAGRAGTIGKTVATAGRIIDPLSATVSGSEWLADAARRYTPDIVKQGVGKTTEAVFKSAPAAVVGFPSGVGVDTIREATAAGRSSGRELGRTPRSETFRGQQVGDASAADIVNEFDAATKRIREAAAARYQTDIAPITRDKTQLDLTDVEKRVDALKPVGLGRYKTNRTPSSHAAWTEAKSLVDQHKALMAQDPAKYATPGALDAFRRELYDTLSGYAEGADKGASRIANGVYHAVRDTIKKQAPDYDKVLRGYSEAQDQLDQMNRALRSGKNIDASVRKMQNVLKRNDPGVAGELLEQADESGNIRVQLAGRSGRPYVPDRLRSALLTAQGVAGGAALAPAELLNAVPGSLDVLTPSYLAGAALMSPRVATSGAYRFGQGVGAVERGGKTLRDIYEKYPSLSSAAVAGVSGAERAAEEMSIEDYMRKYGVE